MGQCWDCLAGGSSGLGLHSRPLCWPGCRVPVPTAPPLTSSHPCIPSPSADTAPCGPSPWLLAPPPQPPGEVLCTDEDVERWRDFLRDAAGVLGDGSRIRKSWEVSRRKLGGSRDRIMLASERGPESLKVGGGQRLKEPR